MKTLVTICFMMLVSLCSKANPAESSAKDPVFIKDAYAVACDKAMDYYTEYYWSPRTGLVYTCLPENVRKSDDCVDGMFHWYQGIPGGYGNGMGDCALIMGTALAGTVDKWKMITDKKEKERLVRLADRLAQGMFNLASLHGIKGFVARGICVDDGKSICSLSSIDQYTHWEHSLWRWARSGMASKDMLEKYKRYVLEVAQFMEEKVIEENGWNFGLADGTIPDPRGICTMWGPDKKAHAAARLPMLYIATWYATGDKHWADMYEKYIDDAIRMTIVLKDLTEEQVKYYMPCYALYQAMCSLEIIYDYEKDPSRRALLEECMAEFSRRAHLRATLADPANPPYGMCWDGELALAAMMDPMYEMDDFDRTFLKEAVERTAPLRMGWCRAAHIYAAWWRYLAREKERTEKQ